MGGFDFGISGKIRFSDVVLTDVKLLACLIAGLKYKDVLCFIIGSRLKHKVEGNKKNLKHGDSCYIEIRASTNLISVAR